MNTRLEVNRESKHPVTVAARHWPQEMVRPPLAAAVTSLKREWRTVAIFCFDHAATRRPMYRVCAGGHGLAEGGS